LDYNPTNPFTRYVQAFVAYAKNGNINETKELLLKEFNKDTSRIDILQDIGKICYYMKQYDSSYKYYKRFIRIRETKKLDVYQHENLIIGTVLAKVGQAKKSEELLASYKQFVDNEKSIYKELGLAGYYCNRGENQKGLEHLKLFSKEDNLQYWIILFFQQDPIMENANAEFKAVNDRIVKNFWSNHKKIKAKLEEEGLLKD
jgi:tetratricopeptide (TPR) repeat protein